MTKPSPAARGSVYQHYIIPWFLYSSSETNGDLSVEIEEWVWERGTTGSWDGLDPVFCRLYEVKLGYLDFIDPARVRRQII